MYIHYLVYASIKKKHVIKIHIRWKKIAENDRSHAMDIENDRSHAMDI